MSTQPKERRLVTEKFLENETKVLNGRLEAVEEMGGLEPGDVTDAQTANLVLQPHTSTRSALDTVLGNSPIVLHFNTVVGSWPARPNTDRTVFWVGGESLPPYRQAGDVWLRGRAEWSPLSLDLVGWYDAGRESPRVDPLTRAGDLGPRGHDLLYTGDGPSGVTLDSTDLGYPSYLFEGTTNLNTSSEGYSAELWEAPVTVMALCAVQDGTSSRTVFDSAHASPPARIQRTSDGSVLINYGQQVTSAPGVWTLDAPVVVTATFTRTGETTATLNGETVITPQDAGTPSSPIVRHRVGMNAGGGQPFVGPIAELIVARNMSRVDAAAATAYLMDKAGI